MYIARQQAYQMRLLGTPEAFAKGRSRDKEARIGKAHVHMPQTQFKLLRATTIESGS